MQRHEVPTHLNIEDRAFAGLTMRQLMVVIIGLALAYAAISGLPVALPFRLVAGASVLAITGAFSLWQPGGRSLEDWAFVLLRYVAVPRIAVWQVRTTHLDEGDSAPGGFSTGCRWWTRGSAPNWLIARLSFTWALYPEAGGAPPVPLDARRGIHCQGVRAIGRSQRSRPISPATFHARIRKIARPKSIGLVLAVPASP